jgi:hypothetical protein
MSSKAEMMEKYTEQLTELGVAVDQSVLEMATDACGPANYDADGQCVAATDPEEVKRVYTNFVADDLAETDQEKGMSAINEVLEQMSGINRKYRAVVYYLLAKKYGK